MTRAEVSASLATRHSTPMLLRRLVRFAFHLFYNPFAFTYDAVSAIVSRGCWRDWTRAAIPRVVGKRVLEVPVGTGNLHLDLHAAGYPPIGVDLSPTMLNIARGKFTRARLNARLVRARAEQLPFAAGAFDSIVMTFPASFVFDARTFTEFRRVLDDDGRVIWVDAPHLLSKDWWNRLLDGALNAVASGVDYRQLIRNVLENAQFEARIEWVEDGISQVCVAVAQKRRV